MMGRVEKRVNVGDGHSLCRLSDLNDLITGGHVAFAKNSDDALGVQEGFRRFVKKKVRPHITDIMRTQKNAVLLWTITPPQDELDKVYGCLKG